MCLTRDALLRLLDNHGPDFAEQWELPVCVKITPGKGTLSLFYHSSCPNITCIIMQKTAQKNVI